jgi:hypothetical protein
MLCRTQRFGIGPTLALPWEESRKEAAMILFCSYEELRALATVGESMLAGGAAAGRGRIERLLPRLTGDVSIDTLDDHRDVREAVASIVEDARERMDRQIVTLGPVDEDAVSLYFDYGYSRSVLHRLDAMGSEMAALADLLTGGHPEWAGTLTFPD